MDQRDLPSLVPRDNPPAAGRGDPLALEVKGPLLASDLPGGDGAVEVHEIFEGVNAWDVRTS